MMRKMSNKVCTIHFAFTLASGSSTTKTFTLQSIGREMKIKSITIDWYSRDMMGGVGTRFVPWEASRDQSIILSVGAPGDKMAYPFTNILGGGLSTTGEQFYITRPGQTFYNSFFIKNELNFALVCENWTATTKTYNIHVIVETEEKTMFVQ